MIHSSSLSTTELHRAWGLNAPGESSCALKVWRIMLLSLSRSLSLSLTHTHTHMHAAREGCVEVKWKACNHEQHTEGAAWQRCKGYHYSVVTQILQRSRRESVECDLSEVPCGSFAFKKQWLIQDDTFYGVVFGNLLKCHLLPSSSCWLWADIIVFLLFTLILYLYFLCAVSVVKLFYIQQAVKLSGVSPEENWKHDLSLIEVWNGVSGCSSNCRTIRLCVIWASLNENKRYLKTTAECWMKATRPCSQSALKGIRMRLTNKKLFIRQSFDSCKNEVKPEGINSERLSYISNFSIRLRPSLLLL